jgi:L-aspartate oxidase
METLGYDYVVLGSGIAGLTFALQAAARGRVAVVCKAALSDTNTAYAQGGIAAVLHAADSFELHVQDTLAAGAGLNEAAAVRFMVERAPQAIGWLQQLGVNFDAAAPDSLALGLEGGHSQRRIVHVKDHTGREIQQVLGQAARRHKNITILEQHMALELLLTGPAPRQRCQGVLLLDTETSQRRQLFAKAIVLATGGSGQVYRHTTNPAVATGDGVAMAARAGAAIKNMEFFQFHPTALFEPDAGDTFLISEALRGAGAELVLPDGSRFMHRQHPQGSLAPRDVVTRAVYQQMRRLGSPCLYLDARHLPAGLVQQHFPLIYAKCTSTGIDPAGELIPVVPAAHYQCGGVATDTYGRTSVDGLYAAGEVACTGVHGANRLASNSLLEGVILAQSAAAHALAACKHHIVCPPPAGGAGHPPVAQTTGAETEQVRKLLRQLMWEKAGIERTPGNLLQAQRQLLAFRRQLTHVPLSPQAFELQNMLTVADLILSACLARKESIGGHYLKRQRHRSTIV